MKNLSFFLVSFALICLAACTKNYSSSNPTTSSFSVYLVDAPGPYDKVNIDIQSVQVKASTDSSENNWQTISLTRTGVYNLLDFTNGLDTLLGSMQLPAGHISQLRLILGNHNSVVSNGNVYPLTTPSAQQSGLKLLIDADLVSGVNYKTWIDFDAARSIVKTGNGMYLLKPVLRTFTEAESGAIRGIVLPLEARGWVFAIANATDTLTATPADTTTGSFLLRGIPAATYQVAFHATAGNYKDTTYSNVTVTNGRQTDMGTITLQ